VSGVRYRFDTVAANGTDVPPPWRYLGTRTTHREGVAIMFGSIGMSELLIIFVIALIVFGPRKLPELGRSLGKSLGEFKRASNDLRNTLEEEINVEDQARKTEQSTAPEPAASMPPEDPDREDVQHLGTQAGHESNETAPTTANADSTSDQAPTTAV
jgi:TatA/E family protein of Tat protein translocase